MVLSKLLSADEVKPFHITFHSACVKPFLLLVNCAFISANKPLLPVTCWLIALINLSCHSRKPVLSSPNGFKFAIDFVSQILVTDENGLASGNIPGGGNFVVMSSVLEHNSATEISSFLNATSAVPVSVMTLFFIVTSDCTVACRAFEIWLKHSLTFASVNCAPAGLTSVMFWIDCSNSGDCSMSRVGIVAIANQSAVDQNVAPLP